METALEELWLPDIWVESLRDFQVHRSIKDQAKLEMDNQSNFYYWQSVTATVSCPMNFALYPFDCQRCDLRFSSSKLYAGLELAWVPRVPGTRRNSEHHLRHLRILRFLILTGTRRAHSM